MSLKDDFSKILSSLPVSQKGKLALEINRLQNTLNQKEGQSTNSANQSTNQTLFNFGVLENSQFLDSAPAAISLINLEFTYLFTNQAYKNWFGKNLDGTKVYDFVGIDHFNKFGKIYLTTAFSGASIKRELAVTSNNIDFDLMVNYAPAYDLNHNIIGAFVFAIDVSHLKETQNALELKNEELQHYIDSYLQLENFAHIASHDLKAPLKNILSFGDLLSKHAIHKLNDQEIKFLEFIRSSARNMQSTIKGLLDFSLISNQKPFFEKASPKLILSELLTDLETSINQSHALITTIELPEKIIVDPVLFRQLLQNLILNAIKFCKNKKPIINITSKETPDNYWFYVKDNGIGIKKEHLQKIFAVFSKLHSKEDYKGTGIGLALSKKIAKHHDGDIFVKSTLGEGSTFYFSIGKSLKESTNKEETSD